MRRFGGGVMTPRNMSTTEFLQTGLNTGRPAIKLRVCVWDKNRYPRAGWAKSNDPALIQAAIEKTTVPENATMGQTLLLETVNGTRVLVEVE